MPSSHVYSTSKLTPNKVSAMTGELAMPLTNSSAAKVLSPRSRCVRQVLCQRDVKACADLDRPQAT
jgi:hypothetical protein